MQLCTLLLFMLYEKILKMPSSQFLLSFLTKGAKSQTNTQRYSSCYKHHKNNSTTVNQRKERLILIIWQTHRGAFMSSIIGTAVCVQYSTVIINYKPYQNKGIPRGYMTWRMTRQPLLFGDTIRFQAGHNSAHYLISVQSVML